MVTEQNLEKFSTQCKNIFSQIERDVIGQKEVIKGAVIAMIAGGNVLLEGVPGVGKTRLVRSLGRVFDLPFSRIQFTPDLMPADVTGTNIIVKDDNGNSKFEFQPGPIFSNIILADEINRATPKTQSALLEAMQEHTVTVMGVSRKLEEPFFVLATQNPIEQEGTYNLPEAELDRFLMKIVVPYPSPKEEIEIVKTCGHADLVSIRQVFDEKSLTKCRNLLEKIVCDEKIIEYIVSIINVTRPVEKPSSELRSPVNFSKQNDDVTKYITYGASPRAGIALLQCAKVNALFQGRSFVLPEDIKVVAPSVLRHRLILSYEANASGITADDIIAKILDFMPLP